MVLLEQLQLDHLSQTDMGYITLQEMFGYGAMTGSALLGISRLLENILLAQKMGRGK